MLPPDSPKCHAKTDSASTKRHVVCVFVAIDTSRAGAFSLVIDDAVLVKDFAVEQVEDVA